MASANNQFSSHEDFRRAKELEEARKAGLAPAALDEEGKEINPHIPQYMASAPWYLNSDHPSLKHQKDWRQHADDDMSMGYDRGKKVFQAAKYRKGACQNCGSMSHQTKDCFERKRVKGARWTNKHIAADEKVEVIDRKTFESKRDRWNGYDTAEHARVVDQYEKVETLKQETRKKKELEKRFRKKGEAGDADGALERLGDGGTSSDDSDSDDEMKLKETQEAGFGQVEKRVRTTGGGASGTVRNLRIREDTPKYLLNLDPNSAHYDPKSRSMREDPNPDKDPALKKFAGDNFVRKSGDYHGFEALQLHSLAAQDRGQSLNLMAAPSAAEVLYQTFKERKTQLNAKTKASVVDRYGNVGQAPPDEELLLGQTERYVEYDASGRVIKGEEVRAHSRYEEDAYINNHTAVWGSFWRDGAWGYACCRSTVKQSYCVGHAGIAAEQAQAAEMASNMSIKAKAAESAQNNGAGSSKLLLDGPKGRKGVWGTDVEADIEIDERKLKEALQKVSEAQQEAVETDERKRKYNSFASDEVTAEEMEAYRMTKARAEDPMNAFKQQPVAADGYDLV